MVRRLNILLLVNPAQNHTISGNLPNYIDESRGNVPPLGLLYLAAMVDRVPGWEVQICDMSAGDLLDQHHDSPDVVGITATTFTLRDTLDVAAQAKHKWPDAPVVLGGIHPTIYPNETAHLPNVDYVVVGEGEHTLMHHLDQMRQRTAPTIMDSSGALEAAGLPVPARHLLDQRKYYSVLGTKSHSTTMFTSRGCPFSCIFCHRKTMGRRWSSRTTNQVMDELWDIKKLGIDEILIYDDTFTVDARRVEEICDRITAENLQIVFDIRARVDTVTPRMLDKLKRAGCKRIHYGVEASSNEILESLGKGITMLQVTETFSNTREAGIETLAYFIIGSPGETAADIERTMHFARELKPEYCHFAIMTPYPATPLYELGLAKKLYNDYWLEFAKDPYGTFEAPFWPELDRDYLLSALERAYRSFYLRPGMIAREMIRTRSLNSLRKKVQGGIKMVHKMVRGGAR